MNPPSTSIPGASEVAEKADELLRSVDTSPFSPAAFSVFKAKVIQYIEDLARESATIAKRTQADVVSAKDVQAACDRLTTSPRKTLYRHLGTVGGLSLGASTSALGSMLVANQFPLWAVLVAIGTGILGAFFLGIHFRND
jgi:histone H3/H4